MPFRGGVSFRGGMNRWFLAIGAQTEPLCYPKNLQIWAQIWTEFQTIGYSKRGSRPGGKGEKRRAGSEEERQAEDSIWIQSGK